MKSHRDSIADEPALVTEEARARHEAENAIRQFDGVLDMIDEVARDRRPFRLRASKILTLHRLAMEGLSLYAGTFRPGPVKIEASKHSPPDAHLVAALTEELCDYVNHHWDTQSPVEICAYVMWRLNWIHPFSDGNGRTSRAVAYLVLCAKLGDRLPGRKTVPEQIAENKEPYYNALEQADAAFAQGHIDVSAMVELLESYIAVQLAETYAAVRALTAAESEDKKLH